MAKVTIPEGLTGKDLFQFLVTNKKALIAEKKTEMKRGDGFRMSNLYVDRNGEISKTAPVDSGTGDIQRLCVINTTNWLDSHSDVHIDGLWKKSLAETKELYLCQEHELTFAGIITSNLSAYTKTMSWRQLGLDVDGTTEALIFDSTIDDKRNPFMYEQYRNNYVKNHSVGMQYVNLEMCINDEDEYYKAEFAAWNKYIGRIANRADAETQGFFWAVTQAKVIEGSAVVRGSNTQTPTLTADTGKQPPSGTAEQPSTNGFSVVDAISKHQFIN